MKVLYLEDNAQDAELVRLELRKRAPDIEVDVVPTLAAALAQLEGFQEAYDTRLASPVMISS
jgi:hypothetical protein